jgi:phosphoenolpyruvate carboxylase
LIYFLAHCSGDEDLLLDTTEEDFYRITQNRLGDKYDRDLIKITLLQWLFDDLREDKPAKTKLDIRVGEKATLTECIQRVEVCSQYRSSQIIRGCNRADENAEEFDYVKCKLNMSEAAVKSVVRKNYNKLFKKHYPIAWGYIEKVKSNNETTLAAELQRAESDLMIRKVIPALVQANVRPIIPIHDSLLTRRSNLKKLREVTNTVMKREGHKPKFDIGV